MRRIGEQTLEIAFMLTAVATICVSNCQAAESPLAGGRMALMFQAIYDFQLTSFSGSTLSLKHHLSESKALRIGLDVYANSGTEKYDEFYGDGQSVRDYKRGSGSVGLSVEYLWYLDPRSDFTVFVGMGPRLRYSWSDVENRGEPRGPGEIERANRGKSLGASACLGVEWFPHSRIGILAQYATSYTYNWQKNSSKYLDYEEVVQTRNSETESSTLSGDQVKLGISAYW